MSYKEIRIYECDGCSTVEHIEGEIVPTIGSFYLLLDKHYPNSSRSKIVSEKIDLCKTCEEKFVSGLLSAIHNKTST